jgi:hypothetical protein
MPVCVAAGGLVVALAIESFTLAWTHSIEKIRWEEDWRVASGQLILTEARIRGNGAGMEVPAGSTFDHGFWRYDPHVPALDVLRLTQSDFAAGYQICQSERCELLAASAPRAGNGDVIEIRACSTPSPSFQRR